MYLDITEQITHIHASSIEEAGHESGIESERMSDRMDGT